MVLQEEDKMRQPSPREAVFIKATREQYAKDEQNLIHVLQTCKTERQRLLEQLRNLRITLENLEYEAEKALQHNRYIVMLEDC